MRAHRRAWLAGVGLAPWMARAQVSGGRWPTGPVKVVIGFTPGNSSDVVARWYAEELGRSLGVAFVVENRPGAGGTLAVESFVRANDDHAILFGSSSMIAAAPNLYPALRYDTLKDLDTVALIGHTPLVLAVRPDSPARTLAELVALSRAGRVRPLAVSTLARLAELPEVPAVAESYPGFEAVTWAAFCVNAGASPELRQRLADAINRATQLPPMRARMLAGGVFPIADSTPASSRAYWLAEHAKWREVTRTVGITIE